MNFDVAQYLQRIGIEDKPEVSLPFLRLVQASHLHTVPFENLDIHYKQPILLDIPKLYNKIIRRERGGFCYEINGLLYQLLLHIGYDAKMVAAEVYKENDLYSPPFSHLAIIVNLEGQEYLTDAGFGRFSLHPLPIRYNKTIDDPLGKYKFDNSQKDYIRLSSFKNTAWSPEYKFSSLPRTLQEFDSCCNFQQSSPESHFTKKKMITRLTKEGRITLHQDKIIRTINGKREELLVQSAEQFDELLVQYFGPAFLP